MSAMLDSFAPDVDLTADPPPEDVAEIETPAEATAEPEVEVKTEPKAEEPKPEPEKQKVVPYGALHEERMRRKEAEREFAEYKAKLEARIERLANPPPPVPKFEEDPAGNLQHEVRSTKEELQALRQETAQTRQQQELAAFEHQVKTTTQVAEQIFAKDHPDYVQAVQYLQAVADRNYEMMGIDDPVARQAQTRQDALQMSVKALQMGKSPAEVAYQLAVNYGYKAAQQTTPQGEAAKKIATLQEGQRAAVSMPSGGTKQQGLTLAALEAMDEDEFNKVVDDPVAWSKLVRQMG